VYDESAETLNYSNINKSEPELSSHKTNKKQKDQLTENSNNKSLLLIVDDSEDVRNYLSGLLEGEYKISQAENGEEGIKVASEINPDLIISDVMMPSMDGLEFCNKIKSNWMTSDIPVILLTAKASKESKLEGLEIGADDYLTKPFDSKELFARIKNLLEQRRRVRDKYNKDLEIKTESGELNSADSDFINKSLELLQKNIDKTNFGTEQLAKELFVSRTQLHRKILSITGQAPGEFIRIFKLKRAAQLLLEGKFSVTQVAYEIGFSSPAQFTRAFTKQFNCLPSEFPSLHKSFS
jgi:DNA-binding response OmpR family regulator